MKVPFTKRIIAYFIDFIIVMVISTVITGFIPIGDKTNKIVKQQNEIVQNFYDNKISAEEYYESMKDLNYDLSKETFLIHLVTIVIYIIYFVVYPVYNKGQTFGKKLMKIKIKNIDNKEITTNNLLIRSLILYGLGTNLIILILIMFLSKELFIDANNALTLLQNIITTITIFMIMLKKNGRGLHDVLSCTMVVNEEEERE